MGRVSCPVYLEVGRRRTFAAALNWPGWCRSGKGEEAALEALAAYAPRYASVAALGVRVREPDRGDAAAIAALRQAILEVLGKAHAGAPVLPKGWPATYATRRIAWHVLDHAWRSRTAASTSRCAAPATSVRSAPRSGSGALAPRRAGRRW